MRLVWILVSFALAAAAQPYDLLLKGGHVIDPANAIDSVMDIAVSGNTIAAVRPAIDRAQARQVVDISGLYVTPGLVDLHAHVFGYEGSLDPDDTALPTGATTIVDAGGSGWRTFDKFRAGVIAHSRTRVLVWINIVGAGMVGEPAESNTADMDSARTAEMIGQHRDVIVGIKTAHFAGTGWTAIDRAVDAGKLANVPIMVDDHVFTNTGRTTRDELLVHLRPGDIHTHMYNDRQMELVDRFTGKVQPYMPEARRRGVKFDLGHGAGSFLWPVAAKAMAQGFEPDTISTDLHASSILGPQPDMPNCMSKMMLLGMSLPDVVLRSTVNPAKEIGRYPEIGTLGVGQTADIAVLEMESGVFAFKDSWGAKRLGTQRLRNVMTLRAGKVLYDRHETAESARTQPAEAAPIYDILLRHGQVIDPANHRAGRMDVAIIGKKIARVAPDLAAAQARIVIDAGRYYVTPGMIDIHTGTDAEPDYRSLRYGVTTAVLTGASHPIGSSKTRLLTFADPAHAAEILAKYPKFVVGVRAQWQNLDQAVKVAAQLHTIVMLEADENAAEAVHNLRPRDIETHIFGSMTPLAPWMRDARRDGVIFDVGGGVALAEAQPAIHDGFLPDTVSTGMDREAGPLPLADMMTAASRLLGLGMTLEQLVERTTVNPARAIGRPELATLAEGAGADVAVIAVDGRRIRCALTIRDGAIVWDNDGLSATDWVKAGPYSNFK